ncbi:HNH endonuclease [Bifidobacterium callitrichos]|uniref:HNH endonuclease domain protein n=1 Tax=Bifidobacterium callitrichos DSM 23973 TaxID=1437609 RepID=A0A087ACS3_9BIFI|nr:HNH endonuclease [Bifidobacterium callitrichos]KFI56573.1 HNH endonuclease domain protein [Bifidobacterium callitrichos DSM 23973]
MATNNPRRANGSRRRQLTQRILASETTCWLCGQPVDKTLPAGQPGSPEIDEDIPVSRGGDPYSRGNCHLVHRWCNRIKSNHSTEWARRRILLLLEHQQPKDFRPTSLPLNTSGEW